MLRRFIKNIRKKTDKKPAPRVEREIWYEFMFQARAWSHSWHSYLDNESSKKPMTKDQFIDEMIKKYKITDREQKRS